MIIRHLCFTGPVKEDALVQLEPGLNLIYGASNTGKSSIVDAIDFMMGRENRGLKELPEHDGYDLLILGIEFADDTQITLFRGISGGDFECYEGLHLSKPESVEPEILKATKPTKKIRSVSGVLLEKICLANKKLKKNASNETEKLSIRTLLPLFLITETEIQKEGSPFISGQFTKKTVEKSRLRLLLTGVDDSSLITNKELEKKELSRTVRLEVLDERIAEQEKIIEGGSDAGNSLEDLLFQKERLEKALSDEKASVVQTESVYLDVANARNTAREKILASNERVSEITEMLARFSLLYQHYQVDILRLNSIAEAGSLLAAMPDDDCPLCGAKQEAQNLDHDCDGNISEVVEAASIEVKKILRLRDDLKITVNQLESESSNLALNTPTLQNELQDLNQRLQILSPDVSKARVGYTEYLEEKTEVEKSIGLLKTLAELEARRHVLTENQNVPEKPDVAKDANLSTSAMDELSTKIRSILSLWSVPNTDRVHYDNEHEDFVFNGKNRISNGKGHRSITHAAVSLGLSKYLEEKELPSLGFIILDSPLLAYEEPDDAEDDLSATEVNKKFFNSLLQWSSIQTIIFENKKSVPKELETHDQTLLFTKSQNDGRYGFFPTSAEKA